MAREDGPQFLRWREEFVSQERGSRIVHYYLEDAAGASHLAVVGTERSLRHMLYVVSDDFSAAWGCGGGADGGAVRKWRSRREVVDWLASFLPVKALGSKFSKYRSFADNDSGLDGYGETNSFLHQNLGKDCSSDITWSGSFWTCGKQLRHYQAFCRNGTTISTHTFVLVLSEEENRYLAYLEDMYEDKKGQKKTKVRWFHQNQEFACAIPPPPPHPCEVFITPFTQVISAECVDDIATVLTPDHYEKCSNAMPASSLAGIRFCFRQYSKNKFKHFDLRSLRGYFSQAVVLSLKIPAESEKDGEYCTPGKTKFPKQLERLYSKCLGTKICRSPQADSVPSYQILSNNQPPGKHLSIKFIVPQNQLKPIYNTGDRLEILSQDSGIIGCWFRCTVLKSCTNHNKLKVQYDDLQNADDSGRLEEMVPASALALPDKLGVRCQDRLRIRPRPQENSSVDGAALLPGTAVDVWQFSGWWEGVVVSLDNSVADSLQVYFPGENFFRACQLRNVRISKDWVKNRWVDIETKSDVLTRIPSDNVRTKQADNAPSVGVIESSSSAMPEQELAATQTNSHGDKPEPKQELAATEADSNGDKPVPEQELAATQANCNGKPVPKQELAATQANSNGDKPLPEQKFAVTQANSNGEKPASEQELAATQANSNGDEPVPEQELAATQANSNRDEPVPEQELATQANSRDKLKPKQEFAATQENSNGDKPVPEEELEATQTNCNGSNKQTEASKQSKVSMTDEASALVEDDKRANETSALVEDDKQTILGKHPRDVSMTADEASGFVLDDKQTILGKHPRDVGMTDEASAFVEDGKQTILGKRPREDGDAEQKCNGEVGADVSKTCLGRPNSLD